MDNTPHKISVVIPVYNESKRIVPCLESIARQTIPPNEIILVDNNCTDDTIEKARPFNVRIVKETQQGIGVARNAGFNAARGDIIARCDADVIVASDWIETAIATFSHSDADAINGPVYFSDLPHTISKTLSFYFFVLRLLLKGNEGLIGPNMVIRRNMWEKIKHEVCCDDKNIHEDVDLAIHITLHGGKIITQPLLIAQTSGRRIKQTPWIFFFYYPYKFIKTLYRHIWQLSTMKK